jgi:hypothetical protein
MFERERIPFDLEVKDGEAPKTGVWFFDLEVEVDDPDKGTETERYTVRVTLPRGATPANTKWSLAPGPNVPEVRVMSATARPAPNYTGDDDLADSPA